MSLLHRLDNWLIDDVAQPLLDRSGRERLAVVQTLFTGAGLMDSVDTGFRLLVRGQSYWMLLSTLIFITMLFFIYRYAVMTKPRAGMVPVQRVTYFCLRLLVLALLGLIVVTNLMEVAVGSLDPTYRVFLFLALLLEISGLYVMACREHPPRRQEARAPEHAAHAAR